MPSKVQADFSGGLYDNPVDAPDNASQRLENLALDSNGKPYQRPYVKPLFQTIPTHSSTNAWVRPVGLGALFNQLFWAERTGGRLWHQGTTGTPTPLSTVNTFGSTAAPQVFAWDSVDGHLLATAAINNSTVEVGAKPVKMYFDHTSAPKMVTAGLPKPTLTGPMSFIPAQYRDSGGSLVNQIGANAVMVAWRENATTGDTSYFRIMYNNRVYQHYLLMSGAIENRFAGFYNGTSSMWTRLYSSATTPPDGEFFQIITTANLASFASDLQTAYSNLVAPTGVYDTTDFRARSVPALNFASGILAANSDSFEDKPFLFKWEADPNQNQDDLIVFNLKSGEILSPNFNPGSTDWAIYSYTYHIVYRRTYQAKKTYSGTALTFTDRSAPLAVPYRSFTKIENLPVRLFVPAGLVLANTGSDEYDVTNTKIEVYRTTANGTQAYLLMTLDNTASADTYAGYFIDSVSDDELIAGLPLYTNGGVLANDPPPKCKYLCAVDTTCYYGNITDVTSGTVEENVVLQSIIGDFDSVPAANRTIFPEAVTAVSAHESIPIVGTLSGVYRIEGRFDDLGTTATRPERVSKDTGILWHQSCVRTDKGMFFAGTDGFYWTNGYTVQKVSPGLDETYQRYARESASSRRPIYGAYQTSFKRVVWSMDLRDLEASTPRSGAYVLDLNFDFRTGSGWSGPWFSKNPTLAASAAVLDYWGQMAVTESGDLFMVPRQKDAVDGIPWILALSPSDVGVTGDFVAVGTGLTTVRGAAVEAAVKTTATNFGEPRAVKWVSTLKTSHAVCKEFLGPRFNPYLDATATPAAPTRYQAAAQMSTQVVSNNDHGRRIARMKTIANLSVESDVLDTNFSEESLPAIGFYQGGLEEFKWRFPAGGLRCSYKQLSIESGIAVLYKSDTNGVGVTSNSTSTLYVAGAPFTGSSAEFGWYVFLSHDDYQTAYPIVSSSTDTLVLATAPPTLASVEWVVRGIPKRMLWNLINYEIGFTVMGKTQTPVAEGSGGNTD